MPEPPFERPDLRQNFAIDRVLDALAVKAKVELTRLLDST